MKKLRTTTWTLAGALLVGALTWSAARGASSAAAAGRRLVADAPGPFWFTHIASQSSASVWLGPALELDGERHRIWTLVCTQPGSEEPLACLQGVVRTDGDEPIAYRGPLSRIELRPLAGWTWAQVVSEESIEAELEGFY
jgi:hypothetical protein